MRTAAFEVPPGQERYGQHSCGNGPQDRVLGGGMGVTSMGSPAVITDYTVIDNRPNGTSLWKVAIRNDDLQDTIMVTFYAICARVN